MLFPLVVVVVIVAVVTVVLSGKYGRPAAS